MSPKLLLLAVVTAGIGSVATVPSAAAQTAPEPVGRVQVGVGIGWLGGAVFGEQPADLRAASGGPYRLFESQTDLGSTGSFEARVGILLSRHFGVEGRFALSKPEFRTVVTSDAEATGSFTTAENIDHYDFDGGVVVRFAAGSVIPFASAGAGYVRQLHEGQALVETGYLFYVGGGFTFPLVSRPQGFFRAVGIRTDLRLNLLYLDLDEGNRQQGSASGSLLLTF